jgi:hypothetical protein
MKPILFTFAFAATLAAQNFIQMSDPQFGMFTKDASFEHETVNSCPGSTCTSRPAAPGGRRLDASGAPRDVMTSKSPVS